MINFHFLFHDGSEIVFRAAECKHYTGHAALTDATLVGNGRMERNGLQIGTHFARFNIALNSDLFGMYPEGETNE
jgi:hypothetical protein